MLLSCAVPSVSGLLAVATGLTVNAVRMFMNVCSRLGAVGRPCKLGSFEVDVGLLWMVLVPFGCSRTLQEGQGRSRTKVEKFEKCKKLQFFKSVNDFLQISEV